MTTAEKGTGELTIAEALVAAREWQDNAELAIPCEIVTALVDGVEELIATNAALVKLLKGASHALRSYQYGNVATDLAAEVADACDAALARTKESK